jgi:hypothetical protein
MDWTCQLFIYRLMQYGGIGGTRRRELDLMCDVISAATEFMVRVLHSKMLLDHTKTRIGSHVC